MGTRVKIALKIYRKKFEKKIRQNSELQSAHTKLESTHSQTKSDLKLSRELLAKMEDEAIALIKSLEKSQKNSKNFEQKLQKNQLEYEIKLSSERNQSKRETNLLIQDNKSLWKEIENLKAKNMDLRLTLNEIQTFDFSKFKCKETLRQQINFGRVESNFDKLPFDCFSNSYLDLKEKVRDSVSESNALNADLENSDSLGTSDYLHTESTDTLRTVNHLNQGNMGDWKKGKNWKRFSKTVNNNYRREKSSLGFSKPKFDHKELHKYASVSDVKLMSTQKVESKQRMKTPNSKKMIFENRQFFIENSGNDEKIEERLSFGQILDRGDKTSQTKKKRRYYQNEEKYLRKKTKNEGMSRDQSDRTFKTTRVWKLGDASNPSTAKKNQGKGKRKTIQPVEAPKRHTFGQTRKINKEAQSETGIAKIIVKNRKQFCGATVPEQCNLI
jgi:hypothetical protein